LAEQISGLSQEKVNELTEQGISVSIDYPNASSLTQQFNTLFFVDGIPGSGKSTIYKVLLTLIGKYHPNLLEKVIVVHNSESNAKNLVSKINVD
jgi:ABC-type multidrug transport system ATPase subunit